MEPGPPQCPASGESPWTASPKCVCPEGTEKVERESHLLYGAVCEEPYAPPEEGLAGTWDAVKHYFLGDGARVAVHEDIQELLEGTDEVFDAQEGLEAGTEPRGSPDGQVQLSVDMTFSRTTYFIGDTHIYYYATCGDGNCTATFTWGPDRFEDPAGMGFEVPWGTPYNFSTHSWTFPFKDPNEEAPSDD